MDYKINVYPATEKEMLAVKNESNKQSTIKIVQSKKLKDVYKAAFGLAVKKFNDTALAGRMIDDYLKSISVSNIPEVYYLDIAIRYDIGSSTEVQLIQKSFADFKKALDSLTNLAISTVYWISYDEFKELQIYFVPISDGYATGLAIRNDLIDMIKKVNDIKDNINIMKAMPLVVEYFEKIWKTSSDPQILSQEEVADRAKSFREKDPALLHTIEVALLKDHVNKLQQLHSSNAQLMENVENEKKRIETSLQWVSVTGPAIIKAEEDRIEAERQRLEEERRQAAERALTEARKKEELRLEEERRVIEAARLKEQAKKNLVTQAIAEQELFSEQEMLELQKNFKSKEESSTTPSIDQIKFDAAVASHLLWMTEFNVTADNFSQLSEAILSDPRRMVIYHNNLSNVHYTSDKDLIGVELNDVTINESKFSGSLASAILHNVKLVKCDISDFKLEYAEMIHVVFQNCAITNVELIKVKQAYCAYEDTVITKLTSDSNNVRHSNKYTNVTFHSCDIKRNVFADCVLNTVEITKTDARMAKFTNCTKQNIKKSFNLLLGCNL